MLLLWGAGFPFVMVGGAIVAAFFGLVVILSLTFYGALWFQAYMSGADVSMLSIIGMSFRQVQPSLIVSAKIMGYQAGLSIHRRDGISTTRLESHFLAGGDVMHVMQALVTAHRAGIDLDIDRAMAIDLAGRNVLDAVRTSVSPKVIDCPEEQTGARSMLSAIAKNGVELKVRARVTVRTNLQQLIGGATEKTIIARVGQGIVAAIGSSASHMDVMEMPSRISDQVLERGLDANTAFEIVSIDIADIDVGENIGARLQADQAEADTRIARALAEERRCLAMAVQQERKAQVAESMAGFVAAEAGIPLAMSQSFRNGSLRSQSTIAAEKKRLSKRDPFATPSGDSRNLLKW
jgi:uncharacterized protein YqfA (UPF0365 family)